MQTLVRDRAVDIAFTYQPIQQPGIAYADLLDDPYVAARAGFVACGAARPVDAIGGDRAERTDRTRPVAHAHRE